MIYYFRFIASVLIKLNDRKLRFHTPAGKVQSGRHVFSATVPVHTLRLTCYYGKDFIGRLDTRENGGIMSRKFRENLENEIGGGN